MTWNCRRSSSIAIGMRSAPVARLALELMLNIAARRQDAHLIGRQHIIATASFHGGQKTRRGPRQDPDNPDHGLQAALDAMPKAMRWRSCATIMADRSRRRPPSATNSPTGRTAAGLQPVKCDDGRKRNYRAHGLRKAALRALAHAGCTGSEMMNVSGHSSLAQLQEYLDEVEQERQADAALDQADGREGQNLNSAVTNRADPDLQTGGEVFENVEQCSKWRSQQDSNLQPTE